MRIEPLAWEETVKSGFTHVSKVLFTDLNTTASTAKTLQVFPDTGNNVSGLLVIKVATKIAVAFGVTSITALNVIVGDSGSTNRFLASQELVSGTPVAFKVGTVPFAYVTATHVDAVFTATTANLTDLSAGELHIFIAVCDLNQMSEQFAFQTPYTGTSGV